LRSGETPEFVVAFAFAFALHLHPLKGGPLVEQPR
jgi:hypothetical protein